MTAYLRSLNVLRENVLAELRNITGDCDGVVVIACTSIERLKDQLDADVREVRADIEALMERNGEGW